MQSSIGLLLCGHGSRDPQAQVQFNAWAHKLQQRTTFAHWETGFMEIASPTIPDSARALAKKGLKHIVVLPGFILGARHTREDIPAILRALAADSLFEDISLHYADGIANHPLLLQAAVARVNEVLAPAPSPAHCHVLVVAHGSTDTAANGDVLHLAEKIRQHSGALSASAAFCNACEPRVENALAQLDTTAFHTLVVLPYFLLASYPVRQLYSLADQFAAQHPGLQVLKAHCLDDHPATLDAFADVLQHTLNALPLQPHNNQAP